LLNQKFSLKEQIIHNLAIFSHVIFIHLFIILNLFSTDFSINFK
jgi:hypothetical protein